MTYNVFGGTLNLAQSVRLVTSGNFLMSVRMKLSTCADPCLIDSTVRIFCVVEKENSCGNIARWIILFALSVDTRLILSLLH